MPDQNVIASDVSALNESSSSSDNSEKIFDDGECLQVSSNNIFSEGSKQTRTAVAFFLAIKCAVMKYVIAMSTFKGYKSYKKTLAKDKR